MLYEWLVNNETLRKLLEKPIQNKKFRFAIRWIPKTVGLFYFILTAHVIMRLFQTAGTNAIIKQPNFLIEFILNMVLSFIVMFALYVRLRMLRGDFRIEYDRDDDDDK